MAFWEQQQSRWECVWRWLNVLSSLAQRQYIPPLGQAAPVAALPLSALAWVAFGRRTADALTA